MVVLNYLFKNYLQQLIEYNKEMLNRHTYTQNSVNNQEYLNHENILIAMKTLSIHVKIGVMLSCPGSYFMLQFKLTSGPVNNIVCIHDFTFFI